MQSITPPDLSQLDGEEAIEVLRNFIKTLEEKSNEELTKKQTKTLKKVAKGIITSIEAEQTGEPKEKKGFFSKFRRSTVKGNQKLGRTSEDSGSEKVAK